MQLFRLYTTVNLSHTSDITGKRIVDVSESRPPSPVIADSGWDIDSAAVIKTQPVLHRDDAKVSTAAHDKADKGTVQLFFGRVSVAEIVPCGRTLRIGDRPEP